MLKYIKYSLAIFALCLVVLVSGEIAARFYLGLGTPPLSIAHPKIEYMFKPDQNVSRFGNNIIINHYGMRSIYFSEKKADDEFRVMVFGDSVINGGNLTDHQDLATTKLQNLLNQNNRVTVGNISAGSWGPGNWLAYADVYGFFDADVVVLVISSHDYIDNPTFESLNKNTHPTQKPFSALTEGIVRYLPRYLPKFKSDETINESDHFDNDIEGKMIKKGLEDLKIFLQLAKNSSSYVFVVQTLEKIEIETKTPKDGYYKIKSLCESLGITTISLEKYIKEAIESGRNPYHDNTHPNEIGQELISKAIYDNLPHKMFYRAH